MLRNLKNQEALDHSRLQIKNEKIINIILSIMAGIGIAMIIALIVILITKNL